MYRRYKFKRKSKGEEKREADNAKIQDKFILPTKMTPFDEDELTALKLSSMNISTRNKEMPSKRKRLDAVHYQETNPIEYAEDAYYWSEDELNSLWIGVRIYGQSTWEAMLKDSRLRFSNFRTPTSLAQRWILERKKIESENIQDPWTSDLEKQMMDKAKSEAEITFMMIQKKAASSSSRRSSASKKRVALNGFAKSRKVAPIKTSQDEDNITDMGNSIDPCKIDIELSLNEWVKGSE